MTFDANAITDVKIEGADETPAVGGKAIEEFPGMLMEAQSADIDGISGASYTSKAVLAAAANCVAQAKGEDTDQKTPVADGTYSGQAPGFSWTGMIKADVTFKDNAITDINIVEEQETYTGEIFYTVLDNYIPRILEAQSLAVDGISGATLSSNGVRGCVEQAIEAAGGRSSEWYGEVAKSTKTVKKEGYDVIIVGMGGSGITSFLSAAQAGAKVFGIETTAKLGGQSATTSGPMAANSQVKMDEEFGGKEYIDADALYKAWNDYCGADAKPEMIRMTIDESGETLDWMIKDWGFQFSPMSSFILSPYPDWKIWCYYGGETKNRFGTNKTYMFENAVKKAQDQNPAAEYMLELTAQELLMDGDKVAGVKAVYYDGTIYEIYGKTVILATGGFIGNADMMNEYLDGPANTVAMTVDDGDGIKLGLSAGGALMNPDIPPMVHINQVANLIKNNDLDADGKQVLTSLAIATDALAVDGNGKLWNTREEICLAPQYRYYNIYTAAQIEAIKTKGLAKVNKSMFMDQGGTVEAGKPIANIDEILKVGAGYKNVLTAESAEDLAKAIDCDAATLKDSLNGAQGPYYAVICSGYAYATCGGLNVDDAMNVLRADGSPIGNLYAVGQDSMGVLFSSDVPYTPYGGQAQSWALTSGRLAGANAAKYAMGK
ncbi:putative fumarate reductase flavoprotein subunit [Desulfitobacterium hafniense Y51]|uniref:Urocanate reductase n=2 Tax=Desulfitobacterium hafniense TaxID=49338 RepID=Q24R56_DESHY|nr:putative fumarate reductase flavoprotein subunit [Desulfitobacterium hafniense Y51]